MKLEKQNPPLKPEAKNLFRMVQTVQKANSMIIFFKSINVLYLSTELLKFNKFTLMLKGFETPITRGVFKIEFSPTKSKGNQPK